MFYSFGWNTTDVVLPAKYPANTEDRYPQYCMFSGINAELTPTIPRENKNPYDKTLVVVKFPLSSFGGFELEGVPIYADPQSSFAPQ